MIVIHNNNNNNISWMDDDNGLWNSYAFFINWPCTSHTPIHSSSSTSPNKFIVRFQIVSWKIYCSASAPGLYSSSTPIPIITPFLLFILSLLSFFSMKKCMHLFSLLFCHKNLRVCLVRSKQGVEYVEGGGRSRSRITFYISLESQKG